MRRIVYIHSHGPLKGLRQILAVEQQDDEGDGFLHYLHTNEKRTLAPGPLPDRLAAVRLAPDSRQATAMRLKTTPKYVVYMESQ